MIKNIKNDKRYVGQTTQDVDTRFRQHIESAYSKNKQTYKFCLSRAIRKHGADSFRIGILAEDVPDEDLDLVEAHYIDMYNCLAPMGYNMSPGFNDTQQASQLFDLIPDDDYSENAKVLIDDISSDDVDKFMKEL